MKVAILGFGKQGVSAAEHWSKDGSNFITICDQKTDMQIPSKYGKKLGKDYLKNLDEFDLIVRSPIIHPSQIAEANSPETLQKVTTNTNEFFRICPSENIIGITGTKGKGTTSTLIAKMLEAAGKTVYLGGNIGTPPLEMLNSPAGGGIQAEDYVVLELANFQLIDLQSSPHIAVCLMVTEEHLDWHAEGKEYIEAKKQLFAHQKPEDIAIYHAKNEASKAIAEASEGQKIPYFAPPGAIIENDDVVIEDISVCSTDEIKLLGQHNWQNICAAVTAVWQVSQDSEAMRQVIKTFTGLEHRLELSREVKGVKYYDDSFGTTPETAVVAIKAFKQPVVAILGGSDKGSTYDELAETIAASNVKKVLLIGQMADKIKQALDRAGYTNYAKGGKTIEEIVKTAQDNASSGDVVLLSPACASFDMFENYEDRGKQFKSAVQALV